MSQNNLIESPSLWEQEWNDMPEFVQNSKKPFAQIIIRVENEADLASLSLAIGQKLTKKTKSAWFPFKSHWGADKKIWKSNES